MVLNFPLFELGLLFLALAIFGGIGKKLKLPLIPNYILAGIIFGPFVLGRTSVYVGRNEIADNFITLSAQIGVVLLLFFIGLEFNFERFKENMDKIGKAGLIDLINLPVAMIISYIIYPNIIVAYIVGGITYTSSSAIITKSLIEYNRIANDETEAIIGVMVFEDISVVPYLAILYSLLTIQSDASVFDFAIATLTPIILVILFIAIMFWGSDIINKIITTNKQEEFLIRTIALLTFIGGISIVIGLNEAVAAFVLGLIINKNNSEQLQTLISPLRDFFAAIFFFWIGLMINISLISGLVALMLVVFILYSIFVKFITSYFVGKLYNFSKKRSIRIGLSLTARGEFSIIIAILAATRVGATGDPFITEIIPIFAVTYVLLMSFIGPLLIKYSKFFENLIDYRDGKMRQSKPNEILF
jgi:monovalent cation:H+ antiporter-2, CPA2 family